MGKRLDISTEQLLAMREAGKTNIEISKELQISIGAVYRHIGKQPPEMTKANKYWKKLKSEPTKEEPTQVTTTEPDPAPVKTTTKKNVIPDRLFDYVYCPNWYDSLYTLSKTAAPEPWCFPRPEREVRNYETPILENYIFNVFTQCANLYNTLPDEEAEQILYIDKHYLCLHIGLYTPNGTPIYMLCWKNHRLGAAQSWYLKGFKSAHDLDLRYVHPLPLYYFTFKDAVVSTYRPEREIRINADHILKTPENKMRLPENIRNAWNVSFLIDAAIEYARRKSLSDPSIAALCLYNGDIRYLLPIHLTNPDKPDLALAMEPVENIYYGHTCLTPQMAYLCARRYGRPSAKWLLGIVQPEGGITP